MWGIVPAAGHGSRMQPLAFSKELLPVGSRADGERERPRAVSEYLVERLILGGADKLCFVIAPGKSDIMEYYGGRVFSAAVFYAVQPEACGLCDAIFRALPLVGAGESVLVGLPDTIWYPHDGLSALPDDPLSFLLFPVDRPELFDAVVLDARGRVERIHVKRPERASPWIWGAFKVQAGALRELYELWQARDRRDEYLGTLVNAWIERGGIATGLRIGASYVDVGTVRGYREAVMLLSSSAPGALPRTEIEVAED